MCEKVCCTLEDKCNSFPYGCEFCDYNCGEYCSLYEEYISDLEEDNEYIKDLIKKMNHYIIDYEDETKNSCDEF